MEKSKTNGHVAQGATDQPVPTVADIERLLKRDLTNCLLVLEAIQSDPDLTHQVAVFMEGRLQNNRLKKELEKQTKLEV